MARPRRQRTPLRVAGGGAVTALDPTTRRALLDAIYAEGIDALAARCGVSPSTLRLLARGGRTRRAEQIAREVWR